MSTPNQPEPQDDLSAVLEIIRQIAEKSADGNYLYRGEPHAIEECRQAFGAYVGKNADRGLWYTGYRSANTGRG